MSDAKCSYLSLIVIVVYTWFKKGTTLSIKIEPIKYKHLFNRYLLKSYFLIFFNKG